MPNGKPGDHPLTDIVVHGLRVYSDTADALIREIVQLADDAEHRRLEDLLPLKFDQYSHPDIEKLEAILADLRDRLRVEARERGRELTD